MKRAASGSFATSPASIALVDAVHVIHQPNVDAQTRDYRPHAALKLISRSQLHSKPVTTKLIFMTA